MAQTVDGHLYAKAQYPLRNPAGSTWVACTETIATTSLNEQDDVVRLFKVPDSAELLLLAEVHEDLDSGGGNLDMDIVLVDDNGTTILYNAGTAFNAAVTTLNWITGALGVVVAAKGDDAAYIGLKVNTAASTAAEGDVTVFCLYRGNGSGGV